MNKFAILKYEPMKVILVCWVLFCSFLKISVGQSDLILVNSAKPAHEERIRLNSYIHINLITDTVNADSSTRFTRFYGELKGVNDTALLLMVWSESIQIEGENRFHSSISNTYYEENELRYINVNDISEITYETKSRRARQTTTGILGIASFLTALIVSPLASIDYGEGGFNTKRFLIMTGGGAVGTYLFYTLTFRTARKSDFALHPDSIHPSRDILWRVKFPLQ